MAYSAYLNNQIFFKSDSTLDALKLSSASISLEVGSSGTFAFTIPPCNSSYGHFHKIIDYVEVYRDDDLIFAGRVYSIQETFETQLKITCEGLLAILNDSIFRPITFNGTLHQLVRAIIDSHNSQVEASKQLLVGALYIDNSDCYRPYQNYATSISRLQDLVMSYGGWIQIRKTNGNLYFDWYDENRDGVDQTIDFGENLLNITQEETADGICTVLIPLGAADENNVRVDITSVNGGLDYITASQEYINQYGYVVGMNIWEDVHIPAILLTKAQTWLNACLTPRRTINLTAVDLSDAGYDVESFHPGQVIKVNSAPHGIEGEWFSCNTQNLNLLSPANNKLSLGTQKIGFIKAARDDTAYTQMTLEQIVAQYATKTYLELAQENLTQFLTGNDGGFMVQRDTDNDGYIDEILFMDTSDIDTARNVWRINSSGWGHSSTGIDGPYNMGASLDDTFVAPFIQAGYLNADLIRAGIIRGQAGESYWNLTTGELHIEGQTNVDKSKVFIREPTIPYYEGDLWVTGYNENSAIAGYAVAGSSIVGMEGSSTGVGVIMTCMYARTQGTFHRADWKVVTNYIDAEALNTLSSRVSAAEMTIVAQQGLIESKASTTEVDALGNRITTVSETLDSEIGRVDILAQDVATARAKSKTFRSQPVPPYDDGDTWVTGAEEYNAIAGSAIAGYAQAGWGRDIFVCINSKAEGQSYSADDWILATKYVSDSQLQSVRQEINRAEVRIDGVNARIDLKADNTTVTALSKRVRTAEIQIDGQAAQISLKASQSTVTELSGRVTTAEIQINGQGQILSQVTEEDQVSGNKIASIINQTATTVQIQAQKINLEGAVSISSLDNTAKSSLLSNTTSKTQFYLSTSASSATGGEWLDTVPAWTSGKYVWTRTATTKTYASGSPTTTYSNGVYDRNLTSALSTASTASANANKALTRQASQYVTCSTAAGTAAKVGDCSGFELYNGAMITCYFANANSAANPTLNVNGTGARNIRCKGTNLQQVYYWKAGDTVSLTYNGTYWVMAESSAMSTLANWCDMNDTTLIDGAMIATGTVTAEQIWVEDLYALDATIGGLTIDSNSIYYGTKGTGTANGDITLSRSNFSRDIGGETRNYLRFAIGADFGVSRAGTVFANNLQITGGKIIVDSAGEDSTSSYLNMVHGNYKLWAGAKFVGIEYNNIASWLSANEFRIHYNLNTQSQTGHIVQLNQGGLGFYWDTNGTTAQHFAEIGRSGSKSIMRAELFESTDKITAYDITSTNQITAYKIRYSDSCEKSSDSRLKKNIQPLDKARAAAWIYAQNPVEYHGIFDKMGRPKHHGLVAQDVLRTLGGIDWGLVGKTDDFYGIDYTEIIPDLIATIQTLNERISALEGRS